MTLFNESVRELKMIISAGVVVQRYSQPCDQEVLGSDPTWCLAFSAFLFLNVCISVVYPLEVAKLLVNRAYSAQNKSNKMHRSKQ